MGYMMAPYCIASYCQHLRNSYVQTHIPSKISWKIFPGVISKEESTSFSTILEAIRHRDPIILSGDRITIGNLTQTRIRTSIFQSYPLTEPSFKDFFGIAMVF